MASATDGVGRSIDDDAARRRRSAPAARARWQPSPAPPSPSGRSRSAGRSTSRPRRRIPPHPHAQPMASGLGQVVPERAGAVGEAEAEAGGEGDDVRAVVVAVGHEGDEARADRRRPGRGASGRSAWATRTSVKPILASDGHPVGHGAVEAVPGTPQHLGSGALCPRARPRRRRTRRGPEGATPAAMTRWAMRAGQLCSLRRRRAPRPAGAWRRAKPSPARAPRHAPAECTAVLRHGPCRRRNALLVCGGAGRPS